MFFYTTLFVTSLVVTLCILVLYRMVVVAGKKIRKFSGAAKNTGPTAFLDEKKYSRNLQNGLKPPNRSVGQVLPANLARAHPAIADTPAVPDSSKPLGWMGIYHEYQDRQPKPVAANASTTNGSTLRDYLTRQNSPDQSTPDWRLNIGRPSRDDRSFLGKSAYRPPVNKAPKIKSDHDRSKPWGW